ncbi:hypothetical protein M011DRAFT_490086 [Sporormia fimetaria CBS 119925]|uniref:Uncharacterized protein n=1 Tax=Sporormia fimetaria CBS 119925 TaxID=1340428 RepID=A0A6A6V109_9PLEO|nr:hypothetical protein M011DRAFT_490086 [Sporormia fimetaria CBS 119925]
MASAAISIAHLTTTLDSQWVQSSGVPMPFDTGIQLPPLTTRFSPPLECLDRWIRLDSNSPTVLWSANPENSGFPADRSYLACQAEPSNTLQLYSPGACYSGHAIAAATAIRYRHIEEDQLSSVWLGLCCKSGMTLTVTTMDPSPLRTFCASTFSEDLAALNPLTLDSSMDYYSTAGHFIPLPGGSTLTLSPSLTSHTTIYTTGIALAQPISVAWRDEYLAQFPPEYASSVVQTIGVMATPANNGSSPPPLETTPPSMQLAVLILGVILAFVIFRYRQRRTRANSMALGIGNGKIKSGKRFSVGDGGIEVRLSSEG